MHAILQYNMQWVLHDVKHWKETCRKTVAKRPHHPVLAFLGLCQQTYHTISSSLLGLLPLRKKCHVSTKQHEGVKELANSCPKLAWQLGRFLLSKCGRWRVDDRLYPLQYGNCRFSTWAGRKKKQTMTHDMMLFPQWAFWMLNFVMRKMQDWYKCECVQA